MEVGLKKVLTGLVWSWVICTDPDWSSHILTGPDWSWHVLTGPDWLWQDKPQPWLPDQSNYFRVSRGLPTSCILQSLWCDSDCWWWQQLYEGLTTLCIFSYSSDTLDRLLSDILWWWSNHLCLHYRLLPEVTENWSHLHSRNWPFAAEN